jgi:hypothetical protein
MPATTHILNQSHPDWTNVVPALGSQYQSMRSTCTQLIRESTSTSHINDGISPSAYNINIRRLRAALWLRTVDSQVTVAFNVLEGPTDQQKRCPKFLICAGISQDIYNNLSNPFTAEDPTYRSIRQAAVYFLTNNQDTPDPSAYRGRLYLWVDQNNQPQNGDWIYPIFQCAIFNDTAIQEGNTPPESHDGVPEQYPNQTRWTNSMKTWKLKRWQDC